MGHGYPYHEQSDNWNEADLLGDAEPEAGGVPAVDFGYLSDDLEYTDTAGTGDETGETDDSAPEVPEAQEAAEPSAPPAMGGAPPIKPPNEGPPPSDESAENNPPEEPRDFDVRPFVTDIPFVEELSEIAVRYTDGLRPLIEQHRAHSEINVVEGGLVESVRLERVSPLGTTRFETTPSYEEIIVASTNAAGTTVYHRYFHDDISGVVRRDDRNLGALTADLPEYGDLPTREVDAFRQARLAEIRANRDYGELVGMAQVAHVLEAAEQAEPAVITLEQLFRLAQLRSVSYRLPERDDAIKAVPELAAPIQLLLEQGGHNPANSEEANMLSRELRTEGGGLLRLSAGQTRDRATASKVPFGRIRFEINATVEEMAGLIRTDVLYTPPIRAGTFHFSLTYRVHKGELLTDILTSLLSEDGDLIQRFPPYRGPMRADYLEARWVGRFMQQHLLESS